MKSVQIGLSNKDKARLEHAKKVASLSTCKFKHGAVVVRGGRVLSVGVNSYRNFPMDFSVMPRDSSSVHAEEAALAVLGGKDARGATMFVARVNNIGEERMSRPCSRCMRRLRKAGIKRIIYTIDSQVQFD